ncbi:3'-5' exonuclease [Salinicola avicenniae]|uniref:3'-5' exonuclease n=1 Tax=Salinicola avicenniae TaxID=2916836 RepID=UPI002072E075|nr:MULTISPECIES: 3'-5' exonuclease [unclassified Salinicola]
MGRALEIWQDTQLPLLTRWRRRRDRATCDLRYRHLFTPGDTREWVSLDCETTDLDPHRAELVTLAAVKVVDERVLTSSALDLRLQPPDSLSGESIRVHGQRHVDLEGGEALSEALAQLLEFIGNRPLLGWCLDYDLAVIDRQLRPRFGFSLPNRRRDVRRDYVRYWRRKHPDVTPDLRFEQAAATLDVPIIGRHTALGDAVTTALMSLRLAREA